MSFTFCSSGAIIEVAGANASSIITASGAFIKNAADYAEARINAEARIDLVAGYSGYSANTQAILSETCALLAGSKLISYDTSGYNTNEAELKLDFNSDLIKQNLDLIKNKNFTAFLGA